MHEATVTSSTRISPDVRRYEVTLDTETFEGEAGQHTVIHKPKDEGYGTEASRPVAFVSTGTCITTTIGMLHEYVDRDGPHATFLLGGKNREQLLYKAMLTQLSVTASVDVEFGLSREPWEGSEGHVQTHLDDVFDTFEKREYYVCGVPPMVVETTDRSRDRGTPKRQPRPTPRKFPIAAATIGLDEVEGG